jgi:hypothetical protein
MSELSEQAGGTSIYDDVPGPLPLEEMTFESPAGTLVFTCSGSGSAPNPPDTVGMAVVIDDKYAGQVDARVETTDNHFFSGTFEIRVDLPGPHSIAVIPVGNTATTAEDIFNVSFVVK